MSMRLRLEDVGYRYQHTDRDALGNIDLEVGPGEIVCVVGPSGSGKSTLLRIITGLITSHEGRVVIDGVDVTGLKPERRPVAMVFQGYALFPHLTVAANIGFGLQVRKEPAVAARVSEVAARLDLGALMERKPNDLSGGERQRVALARSLVRDPAVFCLDEPLASLDPSMRTNARRLLAELLRADGRAAVFVTHDQAEAMTLGDRIAVLRDGRLEQVGTPREVYRAPATAFVASFIGSPPANVLSPAAAAALGRGEAGVLLARPEHVRLADSGTPGRVAEVADLGPVVHVTIAIADSVVVVTTTPALAPALGAEVFVQVDEVLRFDRP